MDLCQDEELEQVTLNLAARKLASFCPTSLSIDDFKYAINPSSDPTLKDKKSLDSKDFIPPSPSVSSISKSVSTSTSRFSFLLNGKRGNQQKTPTLSKMKYELPNLHKLGAASKSLRPLMVVSLSNFDLAGTAKGDLLSPVLVKKKDPILKEAHQINVEISSSSEDDNKK